MSFEFIYGDKSTPQINGPLCECAALAIGRGEPFAQAMTLGVVQGGELIAVAVFYNYTREFGTIQLSVAALAKGWMSRRVVREIARLAYEVNGCQTIFSRCDAENLDACVTLEKIGFNKIILPNMCGAGRDEAFFHMTKTMWDQSELS